MEDKKKRAKKGTTIQRQDASVDGSGILPRREVCGQVRVPEIKAFQSAI